MGRRSRSKGVATAAIRAARRAGAQRDERAHHIAQSVYNVATSNAIEGTPLSDKPEVEAPLIVAAHHLARAIMIAHEMEPTERTRLLIASYLVFLWRGEALKFDPAAFEAWAASSEAEAEAERP